MRSQKFGFDSQIRKVAISGPSLSPNTLQFLTKNLWVLYHARFSKNPFGGLSIDASSYTKNESQKSSSKYFVAKILGLIFLEILDYLGSHVSK